MIDTLIESGFVKENRNMTAWIYKTARKHLFQLQAYLLNLEMAGRLWLIWIKKKKQQQQGEATRYRIHSLSWFVLLWLISYCYCSLMLWTGVIINQCYLVSSSPTSFFPLWDHNSKAFICHLREIEAQTETWLILSEGRGKTHKERWFCTGGPRLLGPGVRWPLFGSVVSVSPVFILILFSSEESQ